MLLCDLPWLWLGPLPPDGAAPAGSRSVNGSFAEVAESLAALSTSACVVVPPMVRPLPDARSLSPEPAILTAAATAGRVILWPAVNDVTGGCAAQTGLFLLPHDYLATCDTDMITRGLLSESPAMALASVVLPCFAATWDCGTSAATAFRAGHAAMTAPSEEDRVLVAALGADRRHGLWWGLGAAHALLGNPVDAAWDDEQALSASGSDPADRRTELARQVRVRRGLALHPLDPSGAAALRAMRSMIAPAALWDRYLADLSDLGISDTSVLSAHARFTRALVWATP